MALVQVQTPTRQSNESKPRLRELYWYDIEHKKLQRFKGTRLAFEYKWDESLATLGKKPAFRLLPKVVIAEERVVVTRQDKEPVMRWFMNYQNYNDSNAEMIGGTTDPKTRAQTVSFDVPDEELEDFLDDLRRNKFQYKVI